MIKREDAFIKAFEIKKDTLLKERAVYEEKISLAERNEPKLAQINKSLATYGAQTAIIALSGNRDELLSLQDKITKLTEEKDFILNNMGIGSFKYECQNCKDTGYVDGKICDCIKKTVKNIISSELSKQLPIDECRFDNFDLKYYPNSDNDGVNPRKKMTQVLKFCREYVINFSPCKSENILFMGSAGLGKTHLTLAMVSELIEKGFDVVYGSAFNLLSEIETEHFTYNGNDTHNMLLSCDLLVIDDLGSEFTSSYIQSVVLNIINTRMLSKRPTVISTNLSMTQIEDRYTPRVVSRLIGNFTAKKFFGADIRQMKANEKKESRN